MKLRTHALLFVFVYTQQGIANESYRRLACLNVLSEFGEMGRIIALGSGLPGFLYLNVPGSPVDLLRRFPPTPTRIERLAARVDAYPNVRPFFGREGPDASAQVQSAVHWNPVAIYRLLDVIRRHPDRYDLENEFISLLWENAGDHHRVRAALRSLLRPSSEPILDVFAREFVARLLRLVPVGHRLAALSSGDLSGTQFQQYSNRQIYLRLWEQNGNTDAMPGRLQSFEFIPARIPASGLEVRLGHPDRRRNAYLETDFEMGATTVTEHQWVSVMGDRPYSSNGSDRREPDFCEIQVGGRRMQALANHPAHVSRTMALEFLRRLDALSPEYRHRLPTGDEWEHMARGAQVDHQFLFFYSNNTGEIRFYGNYSTGPIEVASLRPNSIGLYDMLGNVWQWTEERDGRLNTRGGSYGRADDLNGTEYRPAGEFANWIGLRIVRERVVP